MFLHPEFRDLVGRRTPARGAHLTLAGPNIFFVTVCGKDRVPWMADLAVQEQLARIWRAEATAWHVGFYLLMPEHLHPFCTPYDLSFGIDTWIEFWKRRFSVAAHNVNWRWQRRAFHHRLRSRIEYEEQLFYVQENPVRRGLVKTADEWPFRGHVRDIVWIGQ